LVGFFKVKFFLKGNSQISWKEKRFYLTFKFQSISKHKNLMRIVQYLQGFFLIFGLSSRKPSSRMDTKKIPKENFFFKFSRPWENQAKFILKKKWIQNE